MSEGPINIAALDLEANRARYRKHFRSINGLPPDYVEMNAIATEAVKAVAQGLAEAVRLAELAHLRRTRNDIPATELYFGRIQRKAMDWLTVNDPDFRIPYRDTDTRYEWRGMTIHFLDDADYCEVGGRFVA